MSSESIFHIVMRSTCEFCLFWIKFILAGVVQTKRDSVKIIDTHAVISKFMCCEITVLEVLGVSNLTHLLDVLLYVYYIQYFVLKHDIVKA